MVHDLPGPVAVLLPQVREAGRDRAPVGGEVVDARVDEAVGAAGVHLVLEDLPAGLLLEELAEVAQRLGPAREHLGLHRGQEGEVVAGVQVGHQRVVLGLEGVVPLGEVRLPRARPRESLRARASGCR